MGTSAQRRAQELAKRLVARLPEGLYTSATRQRDLERRAQAEELGYDFPLVVWSNDWLTYSMARTGSYEFAQKHFLAQSVFPRLDPAGVAVDVGSNVGTYTLFLASRFARVLAFDPSEDACRLLTMSLQANAVENVSVVNAGLGAARGSMRLVIPDGGVANRGGARLVADDAAGDGEPVSVEVGDEMLRDHPGVAYIKIDVEGAEMEVLQGLRETLARDRPVISVEVLTPQAKSRVEDILGGLGYSGVALVQGRGSRRAVPFSEVVQLAGLNLVHFLPDGTARELVGTEVSDLR